MNNIIKLKIAIGYEVKRKSWGGGNQFVASLVKAAEKNGYQIRYDLKDKDIDIILIIDPRSYCDGITFGLFEIFKYIKFTNKYALVVHRINECDERKNTKHINRLLRNTNYIADHTVFIASWLKGLNIYQSKKPYSIILNGADQNIFNNNKNKSWDKKTPLKIVTHHWSSNHMKGFDIYRRLDELLLNKEWEYKFEFTYIGNLPDRFKFKKSKHLPPINGKNLGKELSKHHVYLTASLNEPAGMHHIEGVLCGLPVLYRDSGALPEYCSNYGISFNDSNFINSIKEMLLDYDKYKLAIKNYPNNSIKMTNEYLNLFNELVSNKKKLVNNRKLFISPTIVICYFLIYIYGLKKSFKNLFYR